MEELELERLRRQMVRDQIERRGVRDSRVLDAMRKVPRHRFTGSITPEASYSDMAMPIGGGQTISQPYMVAVMTEQLALTGAERVLEIGTGSGYQAAVLSELAAEVYSVERVGSLSKGAGRTLKELGYENVHLRAGDGTLGWPEEAPFDRIMVTAAAPELPRPLVEQLAMGGIIVAPVGSRDTQELVRAVKGPDGLRMSYSVLCMFVPLVGEYGWRG